MLYPVCVATRLWKPIVTLGLWVVFLFSVLLVLQQADSQDFSHTSNLWPVYGGTMRRVTFVCKYMRISEILLKASIAIGRIYSGVLSKAFVCFSRSSYGVSAVALFSHGELYLRPPGRKCGKWSANNRGPLGQESHCPPSQAIRVWFVCLFFCGKLLESLKSQAKDSSFKLWAMKHVCM